MNRLVEEYYDNPGNNINFKYKVTEAVQPINYLEFMYLPLKKKETPSDKVKIALSDANIYRKGDHLLSDNCIYINLSETDSGSIPPKYYIHTTKDRGDKYVQVTEEELLSNIKNFVGDIECREELPKLKLPSEEDMKDSLDRWVTSLAGAKIVYIPKEGYEVPNNLKQTDFAREVMRKYGRLDTEKTLSNTNENVEAVMKDKPYTPHYQSKKIQPLEYILANDLDFCEGNVVKYVTRYKEKNGMEDLLKAKDYLETIIKNYK